MSGFFVKNNGNEYEADIINSRIVYTVRYKDSGIVEDNVEEYRIQDLFPPNQEEIDKTVKGENKS